MLVCSAITVTECYTSTPGSFSTRVIKSAPIHKCYQYHSLGDYVLVTETNFKKEKKKKSPRKGSLEDPELGADIVLACQSHKNLHVHELLILIPPLHL